MNKYIFTLCVFSFFFQCDNQESTTKNLDESKSLNNTVQYKKIDNEIVPFMDTERLFLNLYFGMSQEQYLDSMRTNIKNGKVYLHQFHDEYERKVKLGMYGTNLLASDIDMKNLIDIDLESIDYILKENAYQAYYKFQIKDMSFYGEIRPVFKSSKLISVNVTAPHFNNYARSNLDKIKENILYETDKIGNAILHLFIQKYGEPKRTEKKQILGSSFNYDKGTYTFKDNTRQISIKKKCCIYFNSKISYSLIKEETRRKDVEDKVKQKKERDRKQKENETKNDI